MTTEERLDKLTERQEALAQSVELTQLEIRALNSTAQATLESINCLVRNAEFHERRFTRMEDESEQT